MKETRFRFGQYVTVKAVCKICYEQKTGARMQRILSRVECEPFQGFIVGARYRRTGEINPGSCYSFFSSEGGEPSSLVVKGSTLVWLVARSMTGKHIDVLDGDVEMSGQIHYNAPWTNPRPKQELSPEWRRSKRAKRDSKGRFLKCQPQVEGAVANGNEAERHIG
jgi:hypothetical protein